MLICTTIYTILIYTYDILNNINNNTLLTTIEEFNVSLYIIYILIISI